MSRPNLGYSNYYWIRQDQKRLEKMRTTDTRTDDSRETLASKPDSTGLPENPTGEIEAILGDSAQKASEGTQESKSSEPISAAAPEKSNPEPDSVRGSVLPPAILPVVPAWSKNIIEN